MVRQTSASYQLIAAVCSVLNWQLLVTFYVSFSLCVMERFISMILAMCWCNLSLIVLLDCSFSVHLCTIFTARRYASAVYAVVVCPSIRSSVTRQYCIKTAKCRTTQTPYDSPVTLFFWCQKWRRNSNGVTPQRRRQIEVGYRFKRRFSINIALYLENGAR